ncbi:Universal stress protein E [Klebsiella oxytoca]|nr:Universal stress protein E [Klebsiella oxytoca]
MAVNLASEENYHNALNEKLVRETIELAEQVNHTEVHLVGAYPVTPINIAIELPDFDPSVYNDAISRPAPAGHESAAAEIRHR